MTTTGKGLFLALEGVEGSGKTTQTRILAERLRALGRIVTVAREPGSTALGEHIRETVLGNGRFEIPALSELFLMLAARASFVAQVVRPALDAGQVVIADRFELSTLAYQGAGRGVAVSEIRRCNEVATGGLSPDATLFLDVPPEEGAVRQREAGKDLDRMERESAAFHERVARGYRALAGEIPNVLRVEGRGSVDEVHRRITRALAERFPETFPATEFITTERVDPISDHRSSFS